MDGNGVSSPTARPVPPTDDKRWKLVDARMRRLGYRPDALIETLHTAQDSFGFLDRATLEYVSASLRVPPSQVYGVATFYSYFTLEPPGEHTCIVCMGTACYINGAPAHPRRHQGRNRGGSGHHQRWTRVRSRRPLRGNLQHRPGRRHRRDSARPAQPRRRRRKGDVPVSDTVDRAERLERLQRRRPVVHGLTPAGEIRVSANVCEAAGCLSLGSDRLVDALAEQVAGRGLDDVAVRRVGCLGPCASGPLVDVPEHGRLFEAVTPSTIDAIVDELAGAPAGGRAPGDTAVLRPPAQGGARELRADRPREHRRLPCPRRVRGVDDGGDVDVAGRRHRRGGPQRAARSRRRRLPDRPEVEDGRQGRRVDPKYVICNADEGDPGAFMDRSVLESDPQRVLEGMAIAGYASGRPAGVHLRACRVSACHQAAEDRHRPGRAAQPARRQHRRLDVQLPRRHPRRRRSLRLR